MDLWLQTALAPRAKVRICARGCAVVLDHNSCSMVTSWSYGVAHGYGQSAPAVAVRLYVVMLQDVHGHPTVIIWAFYGWSILGPSSFGLCLACRPSWPLA
eukprot:9075137-Lingulodinium_polyedra.AAC.1